MGSNIEDRRSQELQHYHTILRKMIEMHDSFTGEIRELRSEMLEAIGRELEKYQYRIEKIEGEQRDLKIQLTEAFNKIRVLEADVDGNTRNTKASKARWAVVGSIVTLVLGGGTLSVTDLLRTPTEATQEQTYEVRASAVVDAAARCRSDSDTTGEGDDRRPTVRCVNRWLSGPHASKFEILVAREWAGK